VLSFKKGIADGLSLPGTRAPMFLRVVQHRRTKKIDALDQTGDSPGRMQGIHVYIREGTASSIHFSGLKEGKKYGWNEANADYVLYKHQPDDATMRDNAAWQLWATAERMKL